MTVCGVCGDCVVFVVTLCGVYCVCVCVCVCVFMVTVWGGVYGVCGVCGDCLW